jgi:hypothetical protein
VQRLRRRQRVGDPLHRARQLPCQPSACAPALLIQVEMVDGNRIRLEAKIGGITPDMLSLSGRCELWFM